MDSLGKKKHSLGSLCCAPHLERVAALKLPTRAPGLGVPTEKKKKTKNFMQKCLKHLQQVIDLEHIEMT